MLSMLSIYKPKDILHINNYVCLQKVIKYMQTNIKLIIYLIYLKISNPINKIYNNNSNNINIVKIINIIKIYNM